MAKRVHSTMLLIEYTTTNPYFDLYALKMNLFKFIPSYHVQLPFIAHALYYNDRMPKCAASFSGASEILIKRK